jgi:tRNA (guanine37-N1)-methyltransferase
MRIDVFTIFPDMVEGFAQQALLGRARTNGVLDVRVHDIRAAATDAHHSVDDSPFGGGAGMVLMAEPIFAAVEAAAPPRPLYYLSPSGRPFTQSLARELAARDVGFSLLCGRYEGVDERVRSLVDLELSIGDYVLSGGELPALVVIDAVMRLLPGAIDVASPVEESFSEGLLEYPQYTRPPEFNGMRVPDVLVSGHHGEVARWRREQAVDRTRRLRPDLLARHEEHERG